MEKLLEMKSIYKHFYGVKALENVNFDSNRGEVHALVGENGAGKSTLIKILAGVHKADSGEIIYEGEKVKISHPRDAFSIGIATIHQEFNLVPYLDAASNISLGHEYYNKLGMLNNRKIYSKAKELFDKIGAKIDPKEQVKHLSVAEKQLIEICKVLSFNVKLLIMDEPTAVLSSHEIDILFNVINSLKSEGVSVIYISHRLEELFKIADRVTVLRDGHFMGTVEVGSTNKKNITNMMIGRDLTEQYPKIKKNIGRTVLEIKNLSTNKLKEINLEVKEGEILGLAGLVGAGRTELARVIVGIDQYNEGTINLFGKPLRCKTIRDAIKKGIALIPEERKTQGLILSLSIENNISLPYLNLLQKFGLIRTSKAENNSSRLVAELWIKSESVRQKVKNLSGGNQQKVVLAKWMFRNYKLMIFDEPTRGVDVGAKVEIYKLMNNLALSGVAIIMISSELPEIIGMSDRILVMKEGKITGIIDSSGATEDSILHYAF